MNGTDYVKGVCRHCGGHLEFPAEAAGEEIDCPHCGQKTVLAAGSPARPGRKLPGVAIAIGIAACWAIVAIGLLVIFHHPKKAAAPIVAQNPLPAASSPTNPPVTPAPPVVAVEASHLDEETNHDFALSAIKLDRTKGSSLVYVTGKIRNLTDRQRFGVKVQFKLYDTNDVLIGKCTDYQSSLDPHGAWRFKALVMESKVATAAFDSVQEDQ